MIILWELNDPIQVGDILKEYTAKNMDEMSLQSLLTDTKVWIRPEVNPYVETYYEYVLWKIEYIISSSVKDPNTMVDIKGNFKLKNDNIEDPYNYLGVMLQKKNIDRVEFWTNKSVEYIKAAVANMK